MTVTQEIPHFAKLIGKEKIDWVETLTCFA